MWHGQPRVALQSKLICGAVNCKSTVKRQPEGLGWLIDSGGLDCYWFNPLSWRTSECYQQHQFEFWIEKGTSYTKNEIILTWKYSFDKLLYVSVLYPNSVLPNQEQRPYLSRRGSINWYEWLWMTSRILLIALYPSIWKNHEQPLLKRLREALIITHWSRVIANVYDGYELFNPYLDSQLVGIALVALVGRHAFSLTVDINTIRECFSHIHGKVLSRRSNLRPGKKKSDEWEVWRARIGVKGRRKQMSDGRREKIERLKRRK